ncbi:MAG: type II toxin-antitoxin system VapC family toxin [Sterolibacteriaceae bacterium]|uniref:Ribonuclease VapC n=1 Tax=Candidatus Methylophosphatis roskildensis TaxID=2899263 RepID=A0A9D7EA44_9PROT|nr:type II toxin-antitoxin system VapC family toxin [Candidatus Methylophosphatis roskildensis]MBK7237859.1 type II toxin-antitoxin system VapC family toxin [Sterolibacteriaceae bacterium]
MIVLDTHVLLWWLSGAPQLSPAASLAVAEAASADRVIASTISVLEIATAARRGRLQLSMPVAQWLADVRQLPELRFEPVTAGIAELAGSFADEIHGDPADRLIAATAIALACPLVTADKKLRASRLVPTVW